MYYYRTQHGADCDLILVDGIKSIAAVEIKYATIPSLSKGFYNVLDDLKINKAFVITPGDKQYSLDDKTTVCGLEGFLKDILSEI
jgi:predicted AAA+ superfamily ATPase